jgi:hypothetical protein
VICSALEKVGISSQVFEQDQFSGNRDASLLGFTHTLLGDITTAKNPRIVILSRCNATFKQYSRYVEIAKAQGFHVVGIIPEEIQSYQMAVVCMSGILERDAAKHGTMNMTDEESLAK